jgi:hypothetical protein
MMSMHSSTHSSQMNTVGPAISLRTSCWLLPQNEQYSVFLSEAWPEKPPEGWCTITREFGSAKRMPFWPAVSSSEPIEAAWPITVVDTAGLMNCMVS